MKGFIDQCLLILEWIPRIDLILFFPELRQYTRDKKKQHNGDQKPWSSNKLRYEFPQYLRKDFLNLKKETLTG